MKDELEQVCNEEQLNFNPNDNMPSSIKDMEDEDVIDDMLRKLIIQDDGNIENYNKEKSAKELDKINSKIYMMLTDSNGFVCLRKNPRVIRYRKYKRYEDSENYYREQLMLFTHWRDEQTEIEKIRHYEVFVQKSREIAP